MNTNSKSQDSNDKDISERFTEMSNMTEKMYWDSRLNKHKKSWIGSISREIMLKICSDIAIFITFTNYVFTNSNELYLYLIAHIYISGFLYFKLMYSNPGIIKDDKVKKKINDRYARLLEIKKQEKEYEEEQAREKGDNEFLPSFFDSVDAHLYKFSYINQIEDESSEPFKYCDSCCIFRLPRMEHCETAKCCILRYSHYSKLARNSIGLCNYNLFIQFLIFITVGSAYLIHRDLKIVFLAGNFTTIGPIGQLLASLILIHLHVVFIYSAIALKYHLNLLFKNQTYSEVLKNSFLLSRYAYIFGEDYHGRRKNNIKILS